ncbi:MAG: hypothetical protein WC676_02155 [Candidatus Omnitrophota bacterium]
MRKTIKKMTACLMALFLVLAAMFCCCTHAVAFATAASCCDKNYSPDHATSPQIKAYHPDSGHACNCQKIEQALTVQSSPEGSSLFSSKLLFAMATFGLPAEKEFSQHTLFSLAAQHSPPTGTNLVSLYLKNSVFRL